MSALYLTISNDADRLVRHPHRSDAIGAALRGAFHCPALPEDMARLLRQIDQPPR